MGEQRTMGKKGKQNTCPHTRPIHSFPPKTHVWPHRTAWSSTTRVSMAGVPEEGKWEGAKRQSNVYDMLDFMLRVTMARICPARVTRLAVRLVFACTVWCRWSVEYSVSRSCRVLSVYSTTPLTLRRCSKVRVRISFSRSKDPVFSSETFRSALKAACSAWSRFFLS